MTTEYRIRLDRGACDGIFACLARDNRFVEATDGLATVDGGRAETDTADREVVKFSDERLDDAVQAASACPVDAIEVLGGDDHE
jgi:ferredoxin